MRAEMREEILGPNPTMVEQRIYAGMEGFPVKKGRYRLDWVDGLVEDPSGGCCEYRFDSEGCLRLFSDSGERLWFFGDGQNVNEGQVFLDSGGNFSRVLQRVGASGELESRESGKGRYDFGYEYARLSDESYIVSVDVNFSDFFGDVRNNR